MLVQIFICTIKFEPSILDLFIFTHLLALNWSKFNGIVRQGAPLNLVRITELATAWPANICVPPPLIVLSNRIALHKGEVRLIMVRAWTDLAVATVDTLEKQAPAVRPSKSMPMASGGQNKRRQERRPGGLYSILRSSSS
jgi:hypothetical protein